MLVVNGDETTAFDNNQVYSDAAMTGELHKIEAENQKQREDSLRRNLLLHIHQAQKEREESRRNKQEEEETREIKSLSEVLEMNGETLESKRSPIHRVV
jgi:hypothetical protein